MSDQGNTPKSKSATKQFWSMKYKKDTKRKGPSEVNLSAINPC